jgi:hypothetical protein
VRFGAVRQQVVLGEHTVSLTVVLGEAALRQLVGGHEIMDEQLRQLADACDRCAWRLTLQVVPFEAAPHPAGGGSMTILRFGVPDIGSVYLPGICGARCLVSQAAVRRHVEAFGGLQLSALPAPVSSLLLRDRSGYR